ncbi:MAG: helix-turn-helix transcriptional regulator [Acidobacteriota bacterium]
MAKRAARGQEKSKSAKHHAFARTLYALRIERQLSQEELSFRAQIDRSYLGQLERGEKEPCLGKLIKLAKALEMPLSEFFLRFESEDRVRDRSGTESRPRVR